MIINRGLCFFNVQCGHKSSWMYGFYFKQSNYHAKYFKPLCEEPRQLKRCTDIVTRCLLLWQLKISNLRQHWLRHLLVPRYYIKYQCWSLLNMDMCNHRVLKKWLILLINLFLKIYSLLSVSMFDNLIVLEVEVNNHSDSITVTCGISSEKFLTGIWNVVLLCKMSSW